MKKMVLALLGCLCMALAACGKAEEYGEDMYEVYYLSNSATKVEMHPHEMEADTVEGQVEELLTCLSTNPVKLEYQAPLCMGFDILDRKLEDGKVQIDVSAAYQGLPVTTQVLIRAAIVRTLTQIEGISMVLMTVEGNPLYDNNGRVVSWMGASQFIDNDGNEINTYELARIRLYFAGESGTELISTYREKRYSTNLSLERFVVEELIAGPGEQAQGRYPSINPNTKILSVMTRDGVCYVNLDDNFLTVVNNVSTDVSVYSIVNSLIELSNVNKVQILVNGEVPSSFTATSFERNLDIVVTVDK